MAIIKTKITVMMAIMTITNIIFRYCYTVCTYPQDLNNEAKIE